MPANHDLTFAIRHKALTIGFAACGMSRAEPLDADAVHLKQWTERGLHGDMEYLARNRELRTDPGRILKKARSVISLLYNYHPKEPLPDQDSFRIARYAYGNDYHVVIRRKLHVLMEWIKQLRSDVSVKGFVDSAPVMEKALARRGGLGWIGKNTLLVHPEMGSYVFIAEIITDLELDYDSPQAERCGTCRRCLEACPTGALIAPYTLDVRRCISYLTIEYRGELPDSLRSRFGNRIYGCDACQEVCPFNQNAATHNDQELLPGKALTNMKQEHWHHLTGEEFETLFRDSAIKRVTFPILKRNIYFVSQSSITTG